MLRSKLSVSICSILRERISLLKQFGLTGLWLNVDSNDEFNAGTVLGYSSDDWESIKLHSNLWKVDGRIRSEQIWTNKLEITVIHRTMGKNKIKWFCFGNMISDQRLSRSNSVAYDPLGNCVPGDETSLSRIREFYYTMDKRMVHYGTRFSRELRDMIRELRKFDDELLDEAQSLSIESGLDDSHSESNPKSEIEVLFAAADKDTQEKLVHQYFLKYKV